MKSRQIYSLFLFHVCLPLVNGALHLLSYILIAFIDADSGIIDLVTIAGPSSIFDTPADRGGGIAAIK